MCQVLFRALRSRGEWDKRVPAHRALAGDRTEPKEAREETTGSSKYSRGASSWIHGLHYSFLVTCLLVIKSDPVTPEREESESHLSL